MRLETERLILRKIKKEDSKIMKDNSDILSIKNYFIEYPLKQKNFDYFVEEWIIECEKKLSYYFVLELKEIGKIIGLAGIKNIDDYNKTGELSYWIFKKDRGKSYLMETKIKLLDFCFDELKLRKLKSEVATFNTGSLNLQKKFGMKEEGIFRKENYNPYLKKYVDMKWFALFKEDWKKISPKLKKELKEKIKRLEK
ncbi:GNAT family N-acetyltransferase [archaeon]|nr:GNAT family N-acetyltransferase [archaeon]